MRWRELDLLERGLRALEPLLLRHAGVDQRQLHVVQRRGARQQVEGLEDEADLLVADARQLVVVHLADLLAVQEVGALRRRVEAADQVHQRRLARARRPHDGDVLAALDGDGDAAQGVDLLVAHHIGLPEVAGFDQRHSRQSHRTTARRHEAPEAITRSTFRVPVSSVRLDQYTSRFSFSRTVLQLLPPPPDRPASSCRPGPCPRRCRAAGAA